MNVLTKIHDALVADGLVIDTQPVSAHPPVENDVGGLGTLGMSDWAHMIEEIGQLIEQTVRDGLFALLDQNCLTVTDRFDTGRELIHEVRQWAGTDIDPLLAERIGREADSVRVNQEIRLRVLRAP